MGKRSNFPHRKRDFYATPLKAVPPLIPHLRGVRTFAEPCAGDGDLIRHLESFGLRCIDSGDIATGQDALARNSYYEAPAITNPPYDTKHRRKLMHALIQHFMRAAPCTWLLIDFDWAATKQAAPFLRHCTDIVMLPRLKWFEGTKDTGKDNHAWYKFDINHTAGPALHACGEAPESKRVLCEYCGRAYTPQRSSSRICSQAHKQAAYRKRLSVTLSVTPGHSQGRLLMRSDSAGHPDSPDRE